MIELNRILRTEGGVTGWGIVLYWFEAAPPDAADKGFARFRSYIPNLMVAVLCEARWSRLSGLPLTLKHVVRDE